MNIWEKSNEYENYENNINKRNKIFKYCHKHAPIEELHAITFPIMEFMDLSVYERISLRPRVFFKSSHLHLWRKPHLCSLFFSQANKLAKKKVKAINHCNHKISQVDIMFFKLSHICSKDRVAPTPTHLDSITGPLSLEGWRSAAPIAVALAIPWYQSSHGDRAPHQKIRDLLLPKKRMGKNRKQSLSIWDSITGLLVWVNQAQCNTVHGHHWKFKRNFWDLKMKDERPCDSAVASFLNKYYFGQHRSIAGFTNRNWERRGHGYYLWRICRNLQQRLPKTNRRSGQVGNPPALDSQQDRLSFPSL